RGRGRPGPTGPPVGAAQPGPDPDPAGDAPREQAADQARHRAGNRAGGRAPDFGGERAADQSRDRGRISPLEAVLAPPRRGRPRAGPRALAGAPELTAPTRRRPAPDRTGGSRSRFRALSSRPLRPLTISSCGPATHTSRSSRASFRP